MGEGAAIFLLKRLADAERDGDKVYAVLRGLADRVTAKEKGSRRPIRSAKNSPSNGPGRTRDYRLRR